MKKKRENMIGMLVIRVPLCSHPIDVAGELTKWCFLKKRREFQFLTF